MTIGIIFVTKLKPRTVLDPSCLLPLSGGRQKREKTFHIFLAFCQSNIIPHVNSYNHRCVPLKTHNDIEVLSLFRAPHHHRSIYNKSPHDDISKACIRQKLLDNQSHHYHHHRVYDVMYKVIKPSLLRTGCHLHVYS